MQVSMAIAEKGFITTNDNPDFNLSDNFLQTLQKIFPFQNVDILEFDGNSCQMINSYNPTNSIFIYTNEQGTFLYTITEATPRVHKNNFIWDCLCYKMEDMAKIESLVADGKVCEFQILKNIMPELDWYLTTNRSQIAEYKVEEKDNFVAKGIIKHDLLEGYACFKLKFSVNPVADDFPNLQSLDGDGSWTFFFPVYIANSNVNNFPLIKPTQFLRYNVGGTLTVITMQDILKDYATENLISIEFIPVFPYSGELGGRCTLSNGISPLSVPYVEATAPSSETTFTKAGIHFPYGHSIERTPIGLDIEQYTQLLRGGGARGFIKLPNGEFPLDFNGFNQFEDGNEICFLMKSEGWKLDGICSADITPYYINFKTDETSQLLIQNQTINAQELRQLNRETEFKRTSSAINTASGLLGNVAGGIAGGLSGGPLGAVIGGVSAIGQTLFGGVSEQINISREYSLAKANYDDKIKTQSLLASMTGKSVGGGDGSISSITNNFSKNDYILMIETNFEITNQTSDYFWINPQPDYDYSIATLKTNKIEFTLDRRVSPTAGYRSLMYLMYNIFGWGTYSGTHPTRIADYRDNIGLNYNLTFIIKARPVEFSETSVNLEQTEILNFPIRHNTKIIS